MTTTGMQGPERIDGPSAIARTSETASSAVAEQARAQVQARYLVAIKNRRSYDQVRHVMLKACARKMFADAAIYQKPMGKEDGEDKFVEGPSIRFAEEAARALGNLLIESTVTFDADEKRIVRYSVTDLETNLTYYLDRSIAKTIERRFLKRGQVALSQRLNSYNEVVYLLPASDDQVATKEAAIASKTLRELILRHLPSDIREECLEAIEATLAKEKEENPDGAKKKILSGFAKLNIEPRNLEEYLGHGLDTVSPAELRRLQGIWAAINTGESNWAEVMDSRFEGGAPDKKKADAPGSGKPLDDAVAKARAAREAEQSSGGGTAKIDTKSEGKSDEKPSAPDPLVVPGKNRKERTAALRALIVARKLDDAAVMKWYEVETFDHLTDAQIVEAYAQVHAISV